MKKHAELWVSFWENIAKLLGFTDEIYVILLRYLAKDIKNCSMIICALRMLFALQNYGYSFHHVCGITGYIFSDVRNNGSKFLTKMARPRQNEAQ